VTYEWKGKKRHYTHEELIKMAELLSMPMFDHAAWKKHVEWNDRAVFDALVAEANKSK